MSRKWPQTPEREGSLSYAPDIQRTPTGPPRRIHAPIPISLGQDCFDPIQTQSRPPSRAASTSRDDRTPPPISKQIACIRRSQSAAPSRKTSPIGSFPTPDLRGTHEDDEDEIMSDHGSDHGDLEYADPTLARPPGPPSIPQPAATTPRMSLSDKQLVLGTQLAVIDQVGKVQAVPKFQKYVESIHSETGAPLFPNNTVVGEHHPNIHTMLPPKPKFKDVPPTPPTSNPELAEWVDLMTEAINAQNAEITSLHNLLVHSVAQDNVLGTFSATIVHEVEKQLRAIEEALQAQGAQKGFLGQKTIKKML